MIRILAMLLLEAAAIASAFLAIMSLRGGVVPGCAEGGGCQSVLSSKWAYVLGQPVSLFGFLLYTGMLLLVLLRMGPTGRVLERIGALSIIAGALWFAGVQLFILHAFCPWCCTIHSVASLAAILLLVDKSPTERKPNAPWAYALPVVLVAAMAIIQARSDAPEQVVASDSGGMMAITPDGEISLYDGEIIIDPASVPALGSPHAPKQIVALTDFTCPHCREMQEKLRQMVEASDGGIGVVLMPAWRAPDGREMHRMMLALWKEDPLFYDQLATEMEQGFLPPDPSLVIVRIEERMGEHFHELAWKNADWLDDTLHLGQSLLAANDSRLKDSTLPQFLIAGQILQGNPSPETILRMLDAGPTLPAVARTEVQTEPEETDGTPRISIKETTVKCGEVVRGEKAKGRFVFTNTGDAPLKILAIKPACGCTTVEGWEQTVAPGEEGSFEITLDTSHYFGKVVKGIKVTTNAGNLEGGIVNTSIDADIWLPVKLSDYNASFGVILKGDPPPEPKRITITVTDEESTRLGQPVCSDDYFHLDFEETKPGKEYELTVSIPHLEERSVGGNITIPLGNPKLKELTIPVYAKVAESVEFSPSKLVFPANRGGATIKRIVTIFCHDKFPDFKVESVEVVGTTKITATLKASQTYRWQQIELIVSPDFEGPEPGIEEASVLIKTNHPGWEEIRIPIVVP